MQSICKTLPTYLRIKCQFCNLIEKSSHLANFSIICNRKKFLGFPHHPAKPMILQENHVNTMNADDLDTYLASSYPNQTLIVNGTLLTSCKRTFNKQCSYSIRE